MGFLLVSFHSILAKIFSTADKHIDREQQQARETGVLEARRDLYRDMAASIGALRTENEMLKERIGQLECVAVVPPTMVGVSELTPAAGASSADPPTNQLQRTPRTALERVLLIDEKLRAATTHKISLWTLAASLDSPHRYLEGCKNVQATLGTTAALIVSITLGSLLDEPISGGGVNVVVLQVYLCLMVTSSLAMLMCVLTATVMYTQLELVGVMSDVDDVLDAILFNIPGLDEHISTAQNFFTYGSWCALVGWWLKLVMLYGWRSPAAALYACFAVGILGSMYWLYVRTMLPRRTMMRRNFEARVALARGALRRAATAASGSGGAPGGGGGGGHGGGGAFLGDKKSR